MRLLPKGNLTCFGHDPVGGSCMGMLEATREEHQLNAAASHFTAAMHAIFKKTPEMAKVQCK